VEILDRRKVELQSFAAVSVESLFNVHAKKQDAEVSFCYDFMQRTSPSLTEEAKEMLRNAVGQLLSAAATVPLKKSHEAKLHSRETVLGELATTQVAEEFATTVRKFRRCRKPHHGFFPSCQ
jgi:hypothetical protein